MISNNQLKILDEVNLIHRINPGDLESVIIHEYDSDNLTFLEDMPRGYYATVYYKDELMEQIEFVMEYEEQVNINNNPYFSINEIILYREDEDQRQIVFDKKVTQEIQVVMQCEYLLTSRDSFEYEIFFVLRNSLGNIISEVRIEDEAFEGANFKIEAAFTGERISSLNTGRYSIQVMFFNSLIDVVDFEISDYDEILGEDETRYHKVLNELIEIEEDEDEFLEELKDFVGLDEIKEKLIEIRNYKEYQKIKNKSIKDLKKINDRFHFWFTGNPGTGKTRIALKLGSIMKKLGIVTKGHVHVVGRNNLIGQYLGETAIKTSAAIEKARGGILFIDEAYSLFKGSDYKDYGSEVIEVLLSEISSGPGDLSIVLAGYPNEMNRLKKSNLGLFSRFNYVFEFPDYIPEELIHIAKKRAKARGLTISESALKYLRKKMEDIYRNREENFGNARFINSIIERAEMNLASRTVKNIYEQIILKLEAADFKNILDSRIRDNYKIEIDESELSKALSELNALSGISNIKEDVENISNQLKYYQEEGIDYSKRNLLLHTVFKGNPGTGKTTVARILAKIYKSLGVLEKGHPVECDRSNLVKGYIGQTAIQTSNMIEKAMVGI